jgi:hypothetical protein
MMRTGHGELRGLRFRTLSLGLCAMAALTGGCRSNLPGGTPAPGDAFLIRSSTDNWAWGSSSQGCCIGSDGIVARYKYGPGSHPAAAAPLPTHAASAADLMAHYCAGAEPVGHAIATDMTGKGALLVTAARAPVDARSLHVDAPSHSLHGYFLDAGGGRDVVLAAEGDVQQVNPSPAAAELSQWSRTVLRQFNCPTL